MSVYFITCRAQGTVKIGFSKAPHRRLRQLQTSCAHPLKLEATVEGDTKTEVQFHARFQACRLQGEWFTLTPELDALIEVNPASGPKKTKPFVNPLLVSRYEREAANLARKIAAIRKREAEGKIDRWIGPAERAGIIDARGNPLGPLIEAVG